MSTPGTLEAGTLEAGIAEITQSLNRPISWGPKAGPSTIRPETIIGRIARLRARVIDFEADMRTELAEIHMELKAMHENIIDTIGHAPGSFTA